MVARIQHNPLHRAVTHLERLHRIVRRRHMGIHPQLIRCQEPVLGRKGNGVAGPEDGHGCRELFKDVLETAIPMTLQDVVLVFATVTGMRDGRLTQESYANKVYSQQISGSVWSAIQITTAAGICAMVDLMRDGALPTTGFLRQEDVSLDGFLNNRFGQYYA